MVGGLSTQFRRSRMTKRRQSKSCESQSRVDPPRLCNSAFCGNNAVRQTPGKPVCAI